MKLSKEQMDYLEQMTMLRVPEEYREEMLENVGKYNILKITVGKKHSKIELSPSVP